MSKETFVFVPEKDFAAVWALAWIRLASGCDTVNGGNVRSVLESFCRIGADHGAHWVVEDRGYECALVARWEKGEVDVLVFASGATTTPLRARDREHEDALRRGLTRAVWCARAHNAERARLLLDAVAGVVAIPMVAVPEQDGAN